MTFPDSNSIFSCVLRLNIFLENIFKDFNHIKIINDDILNIFKKINLGQNMIEFGILHYNIS